MTHINSKLTYDEWRSKVVVNLSPDLIEDMKGFYALDAVEEVEAALKYEYDEYIRTFNL